MRDGIKSPFRHAASPSAPHFVHFVINSMHTGLGKQSCLDCVPRYHLSTTYKFASPLRLSSMPWSSTVSCLGRMHDFQAYAREVL